MERTAAEERQVQVMAAREPRGGEREGRVPAEEAVVSRVRCTIRALCRRGRRAEPTVGTLPAGQRRGERRDEAREREGFGVDGRHLKRDVSALSDRPGPDEPVNDDREEDARPEEFKMRVRAVLESFGPQPPDPPFSSDPLVVPQQEDGSMFLLLDFADFLKRNNLDVIDGSRFTVAAQDLRNMLASTDMIPGVKWLDALRFAWQNRHKINGEDARLEGSPARDGRELRGPPKRERSTAATPFAWGVLHRTAKRVDSGTRLGLISEVYLRWDGVEAHRSAYEKTAVGKMSKKVKTSMSRTKPASTMRNIFRNSRRTYSSNISGNQ